MITANKYIKMLGMNIDEVCKAIDSLSEKDADVHRGFGLVKALKKKILIYYNMKGYKT